VRAIAARASPKWRGGGESVSPSTRPCREVIGPCRGGLVERAPTCTLQEHALALCELLGLLLQRRLQRAPERQELVMGGFFRSNLGLPRSIARREGVVRRCDLLRPGCPLCLVEGLGFRV